jgi:hypothetical protein
MTTSLQGRIVKSNELLILDDPQTIWVVKSGMLVLHGISVKDRELTGTRRFLFNVGTGEALFGATLAPTAKHDERRGILAVAIAETELQKLTLTELVGQVKAGDVETIALIEGWLSHLGAWLMAQPIQTVAPTNSVVAAGTHYLSLLKEQTLVPPRPSLSNEQVNQTVAWVNIRQGSTNWRGMADLKLDQKSPPIPLVFGTWLTAETAVEVYTTPTQEIEKIETLPASLDQLHAYFWHCFNLLEQQQIESEFRRFQERQQFDGRISGSIANPIRRSRPRRQSLVDCGWGCR